MAELHLRRCINKDIKVGDTVKIVDGSGLTHNGKRKYIYSSYESATKSKLPLSEMYFKVVETNVEDKISETANPKTFYLQDLAIEFNGEVFRTCSAFVKKDGPIYTAGDKFIIQGEEYILAVVDTLSYVLISLKSGSRWKDVIKVSSHKLTQQDLTEIGDETMYFVPTSKK
jgi:hypothetical protein